MRNFEISKKRVSLICGFLLIFIIGTILIFITPTTIKVTYGLSIQTEDGVNIAFNVFEPQNGATNKKAIIIGHGVYANKEMMKGYAIELATVGYVAIPFDFRGHGQSTGSRSGDLTNDIKAIKSYLSSRTDIDMNNLGYLGFSMGGIGQALVNEDTDFKCFIGTATWLSDDLRRGNSTNPLNVLMIVALYDELLDLPGLKAIMANRTNISPSNFNVNRLYGSFQTGNASRIYLDDNTNHVFGQWDTDFYREARNWIINTFPDVIQTNENFFGHIRFFILILQLFGGLGLFFLIIEPLSYLFLRTKETQLTYQKYDVDVSNPIRNAASIIAYSLLFGLPGMIIMLLISLPLGLAIMSMVLTLTFGHAFGLLIFLWIKGKKAHIPFKDVIKRPFQGKKEQILSQLILGLVLAAVLFIILYLSIGMNFFGLIPSITKILWLPIYMVIMFFVLNIFGMVFQMSIQSQYQQNLKNVIKIALFSFTMVFLYNFTYVFSLSLLMGSFFYFGFMVPLTVPIFLLISFVWAVSYKKTGNIIVGSITATFFFVMLVSTSSLLGNILSLFSMF
jgi:pimeloyl-ACP methyl ester carboxylesterase